MQNVKILMADDEQDVLDLMERRVSKEGYIVTKALDGEEAWEKIIKEDPDVIILDLRMPKLDGFMVLERLRKNPPTTKWQPVIIVSALSELEDIKKGFDLEADHYLTKPCDMEDIIKAIRMMVNLIPQRKSKLEMERKNK